MLILMLFLIIVILLLIPIRALSFQRTCHAEVRFEGAATMEKDGSDWERNFGNMIHMIVIWP